MSESINWWNSMPNHEEGVTHRNMTNGELFKERAAKTALVVLAILVAIGIAVAIYYCCTTTKKFLGGWESYGGWEVSNAPCTVFPAILGTPIVIGLLMTACSIRRREGGDGWERPKLAIQ